MIIRDPISEHVLVVFMDDDVDGVVLIVRLLQVLDEGIVRLHASLLRFLLIQVNDVALHQLSKVLNLILAVHVVLLLLLLLHLLLLHLVLIDLRRLLLDFHHLFKFL